MDVLHPKCTGLDVHQQTVVACARTGAGKAVTYDVRTFGATTAELLALSDWLTAHGCTHVALESSGVYWQPVWHALRGRFEPVLANGMHIRHIPGRTSDVKADTRTADRPARPGGPPSPRHAHAAPDPDRGAGSRRARGGGAPGRRPRPLSRRPRPPDHHARRQRDRGARHRGRDRLRYDPLSHRGPSRLLGRPLPPAPRERRQAPLESDAVE